MATPPPDPVGPIYALGGALNLTQILSTLAAAAILGILAFGRGWIMKRFPRIPRWLLRVDPWLGFILGGLFVTFGPLGYASWPMIGATLVLFTVIGWCFGWLGDRTVAKWEESHRPPVPEIAPTEGAPTTKPPIQWTMNPERAHPAALPAGFTFAGISIAPLREGSNLLLSITNHNEPGIFAVGYIIRKLEGEITVTRCIERDIRKFFPWAPPKGELHPPHSARLLYVEAGLTYLDVGRARLAYTETAATYRKVTLYAYSEIDGEARMGEQLEIEGRSGEYIRLEIQILVYRKTEHSHRIEWDGRYVLVWADDAIDPTVTVDAISQVISD